MNFLNFWKSFFAPITLGIGGGGGGSPAPQNTTVNNSTLPAYLQPAVEQMIGTAQQQMYNYQTNPDGTMSPTSIKGYIPYGATVQTDANGNPVYGANGNPVYTNSAADQAKAAVAGFTPLQQQYQNNVANLQMPGQFGQATDATNRAINQAQNAQYNYGPSNYLQANAPQLQNYQMQGPANVQGANANAAGLGATPTMQAAQMSGPQQVGTQDYTGQNVQNYMSPYMQNVVDTQTREANRNYDISGNQTNAQATQAGAFGGGRQAIMQAENERNRNTALNQIQATGAQNAFQNAQQQFNAQQNANLQAQQANQQAGLTTGSQNAQLQQQANANNQALAGQYGITGAGYQQAANLQNAQLQQQANLANQQMGYNTNNANLQALLGTQQLGSGQNLQAQLANQQGYQNAQQLNAQQQQFGANYGLQNLQQQLAGAGQLGNLGTSSLAGIASILGLQQNAGAQQQGQAQNVINQAIQNYAQQQQYPQQQIQYFSNLIHGLPGSTTTTQSYQAAPSTVSQLGGIGMLGAGMYGLAKAKGGVIKSMAKGGIVGFKEGGKTDSDLIDALDFSANAPSAGYIEGLGFQTPPPMVNGRVGANVDALGGNIRAGLSGTAMMTPDKKILTKPGMMDLGYSTEAGPGTLDLRIQRAIQEQQAGKGKPYSVAANYNIPFAEGGPVSFDVGGSVDATLNEMDEAHLQEIVKTSPSQSIRQEAAKILGERAMENQAMGKGVAQAPTAPMQMAGGGIVAFGNPALNPNEDQQVDSDTPAKSDTKGMSFEERLALAEKSKGKDAAPKSGLFKSAIPSASLPSFGSFDTNLQQYQPQDESKNGIVSPKAAAFNANIPGAGPTFDPTAGGNPAVTNLTKGLGNTPQAPQAPQAPIGGALDNVESFYKRMQELQGPSEDRKAMAEQFKSDRAEAKAQKEKDMWLSLVKAGSAAMSSTSPYAGVGLGKAGEAGVEGMQYANKAYNQALKDAQTGELDLAKLNNSDRTNLLHYAVTGAVSDSNMRTKMAELKEIAATRAAGAGQANLARQDAAITARAKLILGNNPMPTEQDVEKAIGIATQQVTGKSAGLSAMDQQALAWAKANPKDPRAATILQRLGG